MSEEKLYLPTAAESSPTTIAKQLLETWKDAEYRNEFKSERVRSSIALQIRALRKQRNGMTQEQLAQILGKAQTWISVLENPEYGKMSVATLLELADAFDTDLEIKFKRYSRSLYDLSHQGPDYFEVPSFAEELASGALDVKQLLREMYKLAAQPQGSERERVIEECLAICDEWLKATFVPSGVSVHEARNPLACVRKRIAALVAQGKDGK